MNHASVRNAELVLKHHAYSRYCSRVEPVVYLVLKDQCKQYLRAGDYSLHPNKVIQLGGIWWGYKLFNGQLKMVTCFGKTSMDLPQATKWARRFKDRINLENMI